MKKVLVANDRLSLNRLYRTKLISYLEEENLSVTEIGLFETGRPTLSAVARVFFGREDMLVSSNLRSNTVALLAFWRKGMTILNGMGRYRTKRAARWLIGRLMRLNRRKAIVIQSRADYRYFRRYAGTANLHWVPGSGGSEKAVGTEPRPLAVQRPDKIDAVLESLLDYYAATGAETSLVLVGCPEDAETRGKFPGFALELTGTVPPEELFTRGGLFLQPTGYGEGIPHTLIDAIVSRMPVAIATIEYLRYGFVELGIQREAIGDGWSRLVVPEESRAALESGKISRAYVDILLKATA